MSESAGSGRDDQSWSVGAGVAYNLISNMYGGPGGLTSLEYRLSPSWHAMLRVAAEAQQYHYENTEHRDERLGLFGGTGLRYALTASAVIQPSLYGLLVAGHAQALSRRSNESRTRLRARSLGARLGAALEHPLTDTVSFRIASDLAAVTWFDERSRYRYISQDETDERSGWRATLVLSPTAELRLRF